MIHWHYLAWIAAGLLSGLGALGYFGAGMASRATTTEDYAFPNKCLAAAAFLVVITLI